MGCLDRFPPNKLSLFSDLHLAWHMIRLRKPCIDDDQAKKSIGTKIEDRVFHLQVQAGALGA